MNLSKETQAILKNFASINNNIIINPGNKLSTISAQMNIMATATVAEEFPIRFGIYSLPDFLGALSLFDSPTLDFSSDEKYVRIKENSNSVKFFAADPSLLTNMPDIKPLPEPDISFRISKTILNQIIRSAAILHVSDFSIIGDGENISVSVGDKQNATSNSFSSIIGNHSTIFKANLKIENIRVIMDDYQMQVIARKVIRMIAENTQIQYLIAVDAFE